MLTFENVNDIVNIEDVILSQEQLKRLSSSDRT